MSRVLLTGATGFLGREALVGLAAAGHEVHAVARRPGSARDGVRWHAADLLDDATVVGEVQPEMLVHLAWYAEHGAFWAAPANVDWVEASLRLLRAFAAAGAGRRVVMAGTCAEYDWTRRSTYPEDAPCAPHTLYGAAKHGLHVVAEAFARERGLSLAWGRLFFLFGPGEAPGRFVPAIACKLLAGERAPMTAGTQVRDFLHVADAGAAFAALAAAEDVDGAVNVASGVGVSLRELAELIAAQAGGADRLDVGAIPTRPGDPPSLVADTTRLRDEVGWRPRLTLEDGIAQTVDGWRAR